MAPPKRLPGSTAPPSGPSTDCGPSFRGSGLATNILKGGAAGKVGKLLRDGLIEEVSAAASLAWRRDDDAGPRALRITKQ